MYISVFYPYTYTACECSGSGSLGDECDSISGQCQCKENRAGRNCEQCAPGLGKPDL